jgi:hypothetical protein
MSGVQRRVTTGDDRAECQQPWRAGLGQDRPSTARTGHDWGEPTPESEAFWRRARRGWVKPETLNGHSYATLPADEVARRFEVEGEWDEVAS